MAQPLTPDQIQTELKTLDGWTLDGNQILKECKLRNFQSAITLVNVVAEKAEAMDHHPDILIYGWNKVRFTLTTHSAGGLTENDFKLAREIDCLKIDQ